MKKIQKITLPVILMFIISSCEKKTDLPPLSGLVPIISLREYLTVFENEASSWNKDAYLEWADINIRLDYPDKSYVSVAAFNSMSSEYESLLIYLAADGTITKEIVKHEIPVHQQESITLNDWKIDSQEALDLMLDQEGFRFIQSKGNMQCSFLKLERLRDKPEQPVVWRLTLTECLGDYVRHIILDPITGEILENE